MHNIDAMKMGESERESMDAFIDQLYEDIGRGRLQMSDNNV